MNPNYMPSFGRRSAAPALVAELTRPEVQKAAPMVLSKSSAPGSGLSVRVNRGTARRLSSAA